MPPILGNINIHPALSSLELLAQPVAQAVLAMGDAGQIGVTEIDPNLSDTAAFCEKYNVTPQMAANCVIVQASRGDRTWLAACVILASTRADVNGIVRKTLDARKVSFAPMETAVLQSGMEYGAITLVGLPADWPILIDSRVAESDAVIIGSGIRKSKIVISGKILASLPNVTVIENLAK